MAGKDKIRSSLVNLIVKSIENSNFEEFPKQSDVVRSFRAAGWGHKEAVGKDLNHTIDGVLEGVGLCVYFGHSGAAFQKLMAMQSIFLSGRVNECYFITQSLETALLRNITVNPRAKPGTTGNRISFEEINKSMDYYHRFITVPMTVIGIEISGSQLRE
jgi:hypothetical protein